MEKEEVYHTEKNGKLRIKDSLGFLKLLSGADEDSYKKLSEFGRKILNQKATDVPPQDQSMLINMAISLATKQFDPNQGVNFITYFYGKMQGEISSYRAKRKSMLGKVHNLMNSGEVDYTMEFNKKTNQNQVLFIDEDSEGDVIAKDLYRREVTAFRMAFGSIPKYYQHLLNMVSQTGISRKDIALQEGTSVAEVSKKINTALSLILTKVLRGNHLDEEEKIEIMKHQGLIVE